MLKRNIICEYFSKLYYQNKNYSTKCSGSVQELKYNQLCVLKLQN